MSEYAMKPMREEEAREIFTWRYEGEYAVYNFSDWDEAVEKGWDITNRKNREAQWLSIYDGETLIAFGRISPFNHKSLLGIGLKPELCSKGLGKTIMCMLIDEAKRRYPDAPVVLTVRTFNERAIKCYKALDFVIKTSFSSSVSGRDVEYYYMELAESNATTGGLE